MLALGCLSKEAGEEEEVTLVMAGKAEAHAGILAE